MNNFTGGLLSYTAIHGCCNFQHWSSCCFVLYAAPGAHTHQWSKRCADTVVTPQLLLVIGKWTCSPTPWQEASGLMQRVLPDESSQRILLAPSVFLFPQDSSTGVCQFQPFFFCSFSAGTSGLWTQQSNVLSPISSEAFELCCHFPVPKFILPSISP